MIPLKEIAVFIGADSDFFVDAHDIEYAKSISDASFGSGCIGWCSDANFHQLKELSGGTVLISSLAVNTADFLPENISLLQVENPRRVFAELLGHFFAKKTPMGVIHPSAVIDMSVSYNPHSVHIGPNVVIEEGSEIGNNVIIGANSVVKHGTIIKDNVQIGSNCTIGGVGFGYEKSESGEYLVIPHIGNVVLENNVEIGNNVCIDRAVMGSTWLQENVKVDNLVHIAHGVEVGKNSLIIANAMIAGSVKIGKDVWVAPSTSVRQKLNVGDNALIGLGSVVVKDVDANQIVAGVPAKPMMKK